MPRRDPLLEQSETQRWIDCALDMTATEEPGQHIGSHYIFCKKVLGETSKDALEIAYRFKHAPLTREACEKLLADWHCCDSCRCPVEGGVPLCQSCRPADMEVHRAA